MAKRYSVRVCEIHFIYKELIDELELEIDKVAVPLSLTLDRCSLTDTSLSALVDVLIKHQVSFVNFNRLDYGTTIGKELLRNPDPPTRVHYVTRVVICICGFLVRTAV